MGADIRVRATGHTAHRARLRPDTSDSLPEVSSFDWIVAHSFVCLGLIVAHSLDCYDRKVTLLGLRLSVSRPCVFALVCRFVPPVPPVSLYLACELSDDA